MLIEESHDFSFICRILVELLVDLLQIEILKYEFFEIENRSETGVTIST